MADIEALLSRSQVSRPPPTTRSDQLITVSGLALATLGVLVIWRVLAQAATLPVGHGGLGVDFHAYYVAASNVLAGGSPYSPEVLAGPVDNQLLNGFRYAPPIALAFVPFAFFSELSSAWVWVLASAICFLAAAWMAAGAGGAGRSIGRAGWSVAALCAFIPVFDTLWRGNVEAIQALLVALALTSLDRTTRTGSLAALAWLKVSPVVTLVPGLRRPRSFIAGVGLVSALMALTIPLMPTAWAQFPTVLVNITTGPVNNWTNIAPASALAMTFPGLPTLAVGARVATLALVATLLLASLILAGNARRWPMALYLATLAALLLPGSISYHYLAILVPFMAYAWPGSGRWTRLSLVATSALVAIGFLVNLSPFGLWPAVTGSALLVIVLGRALWLRPTDGWSYLRG